MRNAVVVRQFDHFRVDQDQLHFVGARLVEDARDQRVDADGLAAARRTGDEQVRHLGQVDGDDVAADVASQAHAELGRILPDGVVVNDFLEESEFQDGLEVDNHVVKVKIDENSEEVVVGTGETAPVLTVSEDGVKVSNIQNAIDYAVEELVGKIDADVTGTSEDGHVTVEVVQENTELKQVVVTTDDIASKEVLDTTIESVGLAEDGSFVSDTAGTYTSAATTVREEIKSIDQALKELSDKFNASSVEEGASIENFVKLDITDDGEGATAVTIDDSELKQTIDFINDDLASETAEREAADAELLGSTASTSAETSIMGLKALIEQLASDLGESAVQDAEFAVLTDAERKAEHCNAGIKVVENGEDGKKIQLDLSLLKIDCGEY